MGLGSGVLGGVGRLGLSQVTLTSLSFLIEPACENAAEDEDEDDYPNEGYL